MNFTQAALNALPLPAPGQRAVYHDEGGPQSVRGLSVRVTSNGVKTFSVFKRVAGGAPERRTIGRFPEVSIDQARKAAKAIIAQLAVGETVKRPVKVESPTLAEAVSAYVAEKEREDGLALKPRTRADYLAMVKSSRATAAGKHTKGGLLAGLADMPLDRITGDAIRDLHKGNQAERGARQSAYALQVLRAVLNWNGIDVPGNPFGKDARGKQRIRIARSRAADSAPVESLVRNLAPWWRALSALEGTEADYLRFLALSGARPGEPLRALVRDFDAAAGTLRLRDTKVRNDHAIRLSRQALAIVERLAAGKTPDDALFQTAPAAVNKVAHALAAETGIAFVPKNLRATFASVAEELVSASTLKRMMNHRQAGDITDRHYVKKLEEQLRAGWQAVADFIEQA